MKLETYRGRGPAGAWCYLRWAPPELQAHVDHLWCYTGPTAHARKRIFPNGCVELLFNFAAPYQLLEGRGEASLGNAFVGGLQVGPILLEQPAHQDCLAVRLRPAGAYAVLGGPLSELAGLSVHLDDTLGSEARALTDRLALATTSPARLRLLAAWVAARIEAARPMDHAIRWAMGELDRTAGAQPIAALRERTGLSKTTLVAKFRDQVGLAPKRYATIRRFYRVLSRLQQHDGRPLVELAHEADYYDQAHMNGEFKQLAGLSPRQFLERRHAVGDGTTAIG